MKMKKIIIAMLLMFVVSNAFSQPVTISKRGTESAPYFAIYFSDLDSTETLATDWFDITAIQGQSIYLTDSLYSSASSGVDSIKIVVVGRYPGGNGAYFNLALDTIPVLRNGGAYITQTVLSLSAYAPDIKLVVSNIAATGSGADNANDKKLFVNIMANTTNYLRPHRLYGNLP